MAAVEETLNPMGILPVPSPERDAAATHRKMEESLVEAERLRQTCRAAAKASAARRQEEKVSMDHVSKSIESAKAVSSFAKNATSGPTSDSGAPVFLAHLSLLRPVEFSTISQMTLPGQVEDDPEEAARKAEAVAIAQSAELRQLQQQQQHADAAQLQVMQAEMQQSFQSSAPPQGVGSPTYSQEEPEQTMSFSHVLEEAPPMIDQSLGEDGMEDSSDDESEESDGWPPKPPLMRFKMREIFGGRFKTSEEMKLFKEANKDLKGATAQLDEADFRKGAVGEMQDIIVGWLNHFFEMSITTQIQMEVGFPIVMMFMLDAIYPGRVPWCSVDWKLQYKRAMVKNYRLLKKMWEQVNMDKAREFRVENTPLRLDNMQTGSLKEKMGFLKLMKRWFELRIHHAPVYDPLERRRELAQMCRVRGHAFKFPAWIRYDEEPGEVSEEKMDAKKFATMPEYKRLIWFLGSHDVQGM